VYGEISRREDERTAFVDLRSRLVRQALVRDDPAGFSRAAKDPDGVVRSVAFDRFRGDLDARRDAVAEEDRVGDAGERVVDLEEEDALDSRGCELLPRVAREQLLDATSVGVRRGGELAGLGTDEPSAAVDERQARLRNEAQVARGESEVSISP